MPTIDEQLYEGVIESLKDFLGQIKKAEPRWQNRFVGKLKGSLGDKLTKSQVFGDLKKSKKKAEGFIDSIKSDYEKKDTLMLLFYLRFGFRNLWKFYLSETAKEIRLIQQSYKSEVKKLDDEFFKARNTIWTKYNLNYEERLAAFVPVHETLKRKESVIRKKHLKQYDELTPKLLDVRSKLCKQMWVWYDKLMKWGLDKGPVNHAKNLLEYIYGEFAVITEADSKKLSNSPLEYMPITSSLDTFLKHYDSFSSRPGIPWPSYENGLKLDVVHYGMTKAFLKVPVESLRKFSNVKPVKKEKSSKILKSTIDLPEISKGRENGWYKPYELPADLGRANDSDTNPKTAVNVSIFVKSKNGKNIPAPDGTKVRFDFESVGEEIIPEQEVGFIFVKKYPTDANVTSTVKGKISASFKGSSVAEKWTVVNGKIVKKNPHKLFITVKDLEGNLLCKSKEITTVAGKPKKITFLNKRSQKRWHKSFNRDVGEDLKVKTVDLWEDSFTDFIDVHKPDYMRMKLLIGSIWAYEKVVQGLAVYIVPLVTDALGNPVPMLKGNTNPKRNYLLSAKYDTDPWLLTAPGYFFDDKKGKLGRKKEHNFQRGPDYPLGVVSGFWVSSSSYLNQDDKLTLSIKKNSGKKIIDFQQSITIENTFPQGIEKWRKWFTEGEVNDTSTFAGEIAISLIPFIGDGRDVLIYGAIWYNNNQNKMTVYDKVILGMSTVGLALDIGNLLSAGGTVPVDATVGGIKGLFKFLKSLYKKKPPKEGIKVLADFILEIPKTLDLKTTKKSLGVLSPFVTKVGKLLLTDAKKVEKLMALIGVTVLGAQMLEVVFELFKRPDTDVEQIIEILEFLNDGPGPGEIN